MRIAAFKSKFANEDRFISGSGGGGISEGSNWHHRIHIIHFAIDCRQVGDVIAASGSSLHNLTLTRRPCCHLFTTIDDQRCIKLLLLLLWYKSQPEVDVASYVIFDHPSELCLRFCIHLNAAAFIYIIK